MLFFFVTFDYWDAYYYAAMDQPIDVFYGVGLIRLDVSPTRTRPAVTSRRRDPSRPAARIRGASWWWTWPNMPRRSRTGIPTREFSRFWGVSLQKIEWYPVGPPLLQCFMVFFWEKTWFCFHLCFCGKDVWNTSCNMIYFHLYIYICVSVLILNSSFGCLLFVAP